MPDRPRPQARRPLPPPRSTATPRQTADEPRQPRGPRRVKPARSSKVAALALSVASTGGLAALFAHDDHSAQAGAAIAANTSPAATDPAGTAAGGTTAGTTAGPAADMSAVTGTFDGAVEENRWGVVQVEVVYAKGVITDVVTLQYPNDRGRSVAINQQALPQLHDEALQAQSAQVDTISGATYTSESYAASLQSAIDAAKQQFGII